MTSTDKIILKDLYESIEGLFAFTLYSRHKFEPHIISEFIEKYAKKGIINFSDDRLMLTSDGIKMILNQSVVLKNESRKNSINFELFSGPIIEINTPYLPNIKDVSPEIHDIWEVDRN